MCDSCVIYVNGGALCATGLQVRDPNNPNRGHRAFLSSSISSCCVLQAEGDYDIVTGTRYMGSGGVYGWDLRRKLTR